MATTRAQKRLRDYLIDENPTLDSNNFEIDDRDENTDSIANNENTGTITYQSEFLLIYFNENNLSLKLNWFIKQKFRTLLQRSEKLYPNYLMGNTLLLSNRKARKLKPFAAIVIKLGKVK